MKASVCDEENSIGPRGLRDRRVLPMKQTLLSQRLYLSFLCLHQQGHLMHTIDSADTGRITSRLSRQCRTKTLIGQKDRTQKNEYCIFLRSIFLPWLKR
jgi:hypothetical protein